MDLYSPVPVSTLGQQGHNSATGLPLLMGAISRNRLHTFPDHPGGWAKVVVKGSNQMPWVCQISSRVVICGMQIYDGA